MLFWMIFCLWYPKKIIASAVSGFNIKMLQSKIGDANHAIRIMPNIAAQFGESTTCVSFEEKDREQTQHVISLFQDLETAEIIDQKLMDAATVLGVNGTAYALRHKSVNAGCNRNRI